MGYNRQNIMKHKLFTLFFAVMTSTSTLFAQLETIDGWDYALDWETYTARFFGWWYPKTDRDRASVSSVIIPSHVKYRETSATPEKTFVITNIGYDALKNFTNLSSVEIPASITIIENGAFDGCSSLNAISLLAGSIRTIGNSAFNGCISLPSLVIPTSVTSIGEYAFSGCRSMRTIEFPDNVTSIGYGICSGCSGLQSVTFGEGITRVEGASFKECTNLTTILWGGGVTTIGNDAFQGCTGLTSLIIPQGITSIGTTSGAFLGCTNLETVTLESAAIVSTDYSWSTNIRSMFGNQVKEYIIGEGITRVGNSAFYDGCDSLVSVVLPNSLISIGSTAFAHCRHLLSVRIPNNVTNIEGGAFYYCTSLKSVIWGNNVTTIGSGAFGDCDSLPSVVFPNSVTTIGESAFNSCDNLSSVTMGNNIISIGSNAFGSCNIHEIHFTGTIAEWCAKPWARELTICSRPDYVLHINGENVQDLIIPNGVTDITAHAFDHNTHLTSVHIPSSVDSIAEYAFHKCTALEYVRCDAIVPPTLGTYVFLRVPIDTTPLYVPAESMEAYKNAPGWKDFWHILPIEGSFLSIDEVENNGSSDNKLLQDGRVIIQKGDKTYTVTGQRMR